MPRYKTTVGYKRKRSTAAMSQSYASKKARTILGNITGKVTPGRTTLASYGGPFSGKKSLTFLYQTGLREVTAVAGATSYARIVCNGMFDVDYDNLLDNKQPLYFDTLLSSTGPYQQYKVISWKTTWNLINETDKAVTVWVVPAGVGAGDLDTPTEVANYPGVKRIFLAAKGGMDRSSCTVTGHFKDMYPSMTQDNGLIGVYNSNPGNAIYGGIVVQNSDLTNIPVLKVAVKHEAYTELQNVDAIQS